MKLLFLSTPVGSLGSGIGGGVELTLYNMAQELQRRGHEITVVAPEGSVLPNLTGVTLKAIAGQVQQAAQTQDRNSPITIPPQSLLSRMWDYARQVQQQYDLLVNFAYDWLPFYLTPFFDTPIGHFVSMGSLSEVMDEAVCQVGRENPDAIAFYTHAQAETFPPLPHYHCLWSAVDLAQYHLCTTPKPHLAWVGRISPEKALEDAVQAAQKTNIPLKIFGKITDPAYWENILTTYPDAPIEYCGFLSTQDLQTQLRESQALLMTPRWVEAFGNVAIEALACGVPVIAYQRGGPTEIIQNGKTGFLVPPDDVASLVTAIQKLDEIDRLSCRQWVETHYSLKALGDRTESWFQSIIQAMIEQ